MDEEENALSGQRQNSCHNIIEEIGNRRGQASGILHTMTSNNKGAGGRPSEKTPIIREARYSDCEAVGALKRRNGMTIEWSSERWAWLWQSNPAASEKQVELPIGWVLENESGIVGYLGNIPLNYYFNGRRLLAAAARGFAVDKEHRSHSLRLAAAFFSQKNVDILLNTSANPAAAAVFQLFKAERIPQPNYDRALFWVIDARGFLRSFFRRNGRHPAIAALSANVLAPMLRLEGTLRRRRTITQAGGEGLMIIVRRPTEIGIEFDEFWQSIIIQRGRSILADRSAAALRWHFGHSAAAGKKAKIICAQGRGKMRGYAVLIREDSNDIGLRRARLADLMAEGDDPATVSVLLAAAFAEARSDGSYILESIGFPTPIRAQISRAHPYVRQLPSWQFWYKPVAAGLSGLLQHEHAWYGCLYDGDASL